MNLQRPAKILTYFFTILLISSVPLSAIAIVNMDGLHFGKNKDAFTADLDVRVSGSSGNSRKSEAALDGQFSWMGEKSINLAIFGFLYGENDQVRNMNKAFMHYRFIRQLSDSTDWELFAQLEKNEFTRLSYRGLMGAGLRFDVFQSQQHHAFLGLGGFYSKEKVEFVSGLSDHGIYNFTRANLYFLSKYKINSAVSFSNVFYFQPRLNQFSDYRALFQTKLDFKINKTLSFRLSLDVEKDSKPSQTIKSTDINYMTGLKLNF